MKKLSKIKLHNAIVMDDREMKSVTGGFVTGGVVIRSYTCEKESDSKDLVCNGTCPDRMEGTKSVPQECYKSWVDGSGQIPRTYYCYCR